MKKIFLILLLIITNNLYSQYIWNKQDSNGYVLLKRYDLTCTYCTCNSCNGNGKILTNIWVACYNCKEWADSYRNARGCDICHNNKGKFKYEYIKCTACAGKGKYHNTEGANDIHEEEVKNDLHEEMKNNLYNKSQKPQDNRPFKNPELKKAKITGRICYPCN